MLLGCRDPHSIRMRYLPYIELQVLSVAVVHACEGIMQKLREDGSLTGWRSESYPVLTAFDSEPLALVERAAAVHLGIKAYGVHINGYVRRASGIELWVARRSRSKPTWPGKLDHIVAGGQVRRPSTPSDRHNCIVLVVPPLQSAPFHAFMSGLAWIEVWPLAPEPQTLHAVAQQI